MRKFLIKCLCPEPNPKSIKLEDLSILEAGGLKIDQFLEDYRNSDDAKLLATPIRGRGIPKISLLDVAIQKMLIHHIEDRGHSISFLHETSKAGSFAYGLFRILDCLRDNVSVKYMGQQLWFSIYRMKQHIIDSQNTSMPHILLLDNKEWQDITSFVMVISLMERVYNPEAHQYSITDNDGTHIFKQSGGVQTHHTTSSESTNSPDFAIQIEPPAIRAEGGATIASSSPTPSGGYGFDSSSRGSPADLAELHEFAPSPNAFGLRWRGGKTPETGPARSLSAPMYKQDFHLTSSPLKGSGSGSIAVNPAFGFAPLTGAAAASRDNSRDDLTTPLLGVDTSDAVDL